MEFEIERQSVVDAGKRLVESGLISRTWGNVSCRINDELFAITPSGRDYGNLTPSDIVLVNMKDLRRGGDIEPSSETRIHAAVYRIRKEIKFVIHTHQLNASVISVISDLKENPKAKDSERMNLTFADYGLPGSKKLCKSITTVLEKNLGKAIIMRNHGALCMGEDAEEAFSVALDLENVCHNWILNKRGKLDIEPTIRAELNMHSSERTENGCQLLEAGTESLGCQLLEAGTESPALLSERQIHEDIYKSRRDVNFIEYAKSPEILRLAAKGGAWRPILDDMAQIQGTSLKTAEWNPKDAPKSSRAISGALKGRHGLLIKDRGALCCGATKKDAEAVHLIMEKACKALNISLLTGSVRSINLVECHLMRVNYLKNYSRKAAKTKVE